MKKILACAVLLAGLTVSTVYGFGPFPPPPVEPINCIESTETICWFGFCWETTVCR
jgi:hypothetical protein